MATFITPRIAPISPSETRHPFHIGRTLGDAGRLLAKYWSSLLIAFVLLRMLPRVIIGEDMDAGLVGNDHSFVWQLLRPLEDSWSNFIAKQIMEVPNFLFCNVAIVILLRAAGRSKWYGIQPALSIALFWFGLALLVDMQPLLFEMPAYSDLLLGLLVLAIILMLSVSDAAAADEYRWPVSAFKRSLTLVRQGPFRLLVLFLVIAALYGLSMAAEELLLTAIPVTDANWFDWVTTVFQECISGFFLPFQAAILVAAFLHLRRRHDGDRPEDTAAIFD